MRRISISPRNEWKERVEGLGFTFHSLDNKYWFEEAYYRLTYDEVLKLESATTELWDMCLHAVQQIIDNKLYSKFHIKESFIPLIEKSWEGDHPSIYGRFDFAYKDGKVKLLEFNADTPTSFLEAGVIQWDWLETTGRRDQFNSIYEKTVAYWKELIPYLKGVNGTKKLHVASIRENIEDEITVGFMQHCAQEAGIEVEFIYMDDIGWDKERRMFVDLENQPIENIFKLYPWEWMMHEEFGELVTKDLNTLWIEPAWKMLLSNKAILPVLWDLFPNHPLLLESRYSPGDMKSYAKKPILSREGANVTLVKEGQVLEETEGEYGEEGYIYQELFELDNFSGNYALIGSWVIGQESAGIGVRESDGLITNNVSRFVPHSIE